MSELKQHKFSMRCEVEMKSSPPFKYILQEFRENMKYDKAFFSVLLFYTLITFPLNRISSSSAAMIAKFYGPDTANYSVSALDLLAGLWLIFSALIFRKRAIFTIWTASAGIYILIVLHCTVQIFDSNF